MQGESSYLFVLISDGTSFASAENSHTAPITEIVHLKQDTGKDFFFTASYDGSIKAWTSDGKKLDLFHTFPAQGHVLTLCMQNPTFMVAGLNNGMF